MKTKNLLLSVFSTLFMLTLVGQMVAQNNNIQYWRAWDKNGINVFETSKNDTIGYHGPVVRVGGSYTVQFQALTHENAAGEGVEGGLSSLGPGFNLATANLNLDFQLDDGVRITVENYMSSRHHSEFWVKGGYIQFDKLPFFDNPEWFANDWTIKIGHFQPNYGDMQFRRTDNANAMYNPLVGNTIMDAFTTEIGGEVQYKGIDNFMISLGLTNGLIKGDISDPDDRTDDKKKNPSITAKVAYDKQMDDDLRVRVSASAYLNSNSLRNTLYAGDRTGSRYYLALEEEDASAGSSFRSGRFSPNFTNSVTSIMINPFVKYKGLEFFGMFETATGASTPDADDRTVTQIMAELLYRFGDAENFYVAGRFNNVSGELMSTDEMSINRIQVGAGWFPTKNLLVKLEYVTQEHIDFPEASLLDEGKFGGIMLEAVVGL
jgi:hypothetical protein